VNERWQSVQEIAEYLSVSTDSVYRWVEQRGLPVHRIGRLLRFKCSEVDRWVRSEDEARARSNATKSRPRTARQKTR